MLCGVSDLSVGKLVAVIPFIISMGVATVWNVVVFGNVVLYVSVISETCRSLRYEVSCFSLDVSAFRIPGLL
jgi:hypothetical protein